MERISLEPLSVRGVPVIDVVAAALLPTSASIGLLGLEARIRIVRVKRQHFSHAHGIHQVIAAPNLLIVAASSDDPVTRLRRSADGRSEEHTSELQSLMRISYAVFCLKKK